MKWRRPTRVSRRYLDRTTRTFISLSTHSCVHTCPRGSGLDGHNVWKQGHESPCNHDQVSPRAVGHYVCVSSYHFPSTYPLSPLQPSSRGIHSVLQTANQTPRILDRVVYLTRPTVIPRICSHDTWTMVQHREGHIKLYYMFVITNRVFKHH